VENVRGIVFRLIRNQLRKFDFYEKIGFPITIGLVMVNAGLGFSKSPVEPFKMLQNFNITPGTLLHVLLPALLFDTSINFQHSDFITPVF
jgi:hypothetical protein